MMAKTLPITAVKTHLTELVSGVEERDEEIIVTRNGRPAAVILSCGEVARLRETIAVLSDPAMMEQIRESRAHYATGARGVPFEDVFGEPLHPPQKRK